MKCDKTKPLIDPLADNELPTETVAHVIEHISGCLECQDIWDSRALLQERFKAFSSRVSIPAGAIERLDRKIAAEASSRPSRVSRSTRLIFLSAAAVVLIVVASISIIRFPSLVEVGQLASDFSDSDINQSNSAEFLADAIDGPGIKELSKRVGFTVRPPEISGWMLVSADVYKQSGEKLCLARLTYEQKSDGSSKRVRLYQSCAGKIKPEGLREMVVSGRPVCCGQIGELTIVYLQGNGMDNVLVSRMSEKELMGIALGV